MQDVGRAQRRIGEFLDLGRSLAGICAHPGVNHPRFSDARWLADGSRFLSIPFFRSTYSRRVPSGIECLGFDWPDKLGSIEAGKLAGFIVIDRNIFETPVEELKETKVDLTVVGGEVVYSRN